MNCLRKQSVNGNTGQQLHGVSCKVQQKHSSWFTRLGKAAIKTVVTHPHLVTVIEARCTGRPASRGRLVNEALAASLTSSMAKTLSSTGSHSGHVSLPVCEMDGSLVGLWFIHEQIAATRSQHSHTCVASVHHRCMQSLHEVPLPTCTLAVELNWTEKGTNQLKKRSLGKEVLLNGSFINSTTGRASSDQLFKQTLFCFFNWF